MMIEISHLSLIVEKKMKDKSKFSDVF